MNSSQWLLKRIAELSEQLRQEALQAGVIDTTQGISCDLRIIPTAATQERVEALIAKFGYKDVTVYPEGLSVATVEVDSGKAGKYNWFFHILPDGSRAYPQEYKFVGPFVRGFAVVATPFGVGPLHYRHIHPDGKPVYRTDHWFIKASPFSEEGIAEVVLNLRVGPKPALIDLSGNIVDKE